MGESGDDLQLVHYSIHKARARGDACRRARGGRLADGLGELRGVQSLAALERSPDVGGARCLRKEVSDDFAPHPAEPSIDSLTVFVDTREQLPYAFVENGMKTKPATRQHGDYSIRFLEQHVAIERKSLESSGKRSSRRSAERERTTVLTTTSG